MNLDRTIKIVWLGCGILFIALILSGLYFVFGLDRIYQGNRNEETGVALDNLGKEKIEAIKLNLSYSTPHKLANTENYLLPIYISYSETTTLKAGLGSSYERDLDVNEPSNVIFLDKQLNAIKLLLNRKALILNMYYSVDESDPNLAGMHEKLKLIVYEIAFEDTNQDGQLGQDDNSNIYLSDLGGNDFFAITENLDINEIEFIDDFKTILISYYEDSQSPDSHKKLRFAKYSFEEKKLVKLGSIDQFLKDAENILK